MRLLQKSFVCTGWEKPVDTFGEIGWPDALRGPTSPAGSVVL